MQKPKQVRPSLKSVAWLIAHPLRAQIWVALTEQVASPSDLSRELGATLSDVAYHARQLQKAGAIELVDIKPVRGSVEHFYRATARMISDNDDTAARTVESREDTARLTCQLAFADAEAALGAGTFCERPDHTVARIPMTVDDEGWSEVQEAMAELVERLFAAEARSASRMSPDDHGIRITTVGLAFEMPRRGRQVEAPPLEGS